jgi:hypothetical protein
MEGSVSEQAHSYCMSQFSFTAGLAQFTLPGLFTVIRLYMTRLYKTNTQIAKELKIIPILDKLLEYKRNWIQHVNRMLVIDYPG